MNFISSSIKALVFIYYITNYTTKGDCSQYQKVIIVAIVRKAFDNYDKDSITSLSNFTPILDKFALKAFNQLSYDRKIRGPLVASYLLYLPNHFFLKAIVKTINIALLQAKFSLILDSQSFNQSDNILHNNGTKIWLYSIYEHYIHCGSIYNKISLYKYSWFICIMKHL